MEQNGEQKLWAAAHYGRLPDVQWLLTEGASPDAKKGGIPALVVAAENGHLGVVRRLVRAGANLEATDEMGITALMGAAANGKHDCVEELLGKDAHAFSAREWRFSEWRKERLGQQRGGQQPVGGSWSEWRTGAVRERARAWSGGALLFCAGAVAGAAAGAALGRGCLFGG